MVLRAAGVRQAARIVCGALLAAFLLFALATFTGCRFSDALANIVDDPAGTYEPEASPQYKDVPNAQTDETRTSSTSDTSNNQAVQEATIPVYDADAPENGAAVKRTHKAESADDVAATEGTEPAQEEQLAAEVTAPGDGAGASAAEAGPKQEGEGSPEPNATTGRGGAGKTYGSDGTYEELPDATCIAACGQYATIVQMLGGSGALAAADATWLAQVQAAGAFPGEGLESVSAVWSGDGSAADALDVDALLATQADVVLVNSAVGVTDAQVAQLEEAGVSVVQVPLIGRVDTADSDVVTAVRVVGQLLASTKSAAALPAADYATYYVSMHDQVLSACRTANGGYSYKMIAGKALQSVYQADVTASTFSDVRISTAYIDSWTAVDTPFSEADRSFGLASIYLDGQTMDASDGLGLSASVLKGSYALIDYYLQCSGVVNNAYDGARPVSGNDAASTLPYPVAAGRVDAIAGSLSLGTRELPSALWFGLDGTTIYDKWLTVGDADFPALLARTGAMADSIAASAAKVNGLYNVGKSYQVYVVPEGIAGSWADGTVESFLLAPWAYGVFQNSDTAQAQASVSEFYELFYRTTPAAMTVGLSDSRTAACPTG